MIQWIREFNLSPEENIQRDIDLFQSFDEYHCFLLIRVYTFGQYCATSGFISSYGETTKKILKERGIPIHPRFTGGALAFHGDDLCMSLFVGTPGNSVSLYRPFLDMMRDSIAKVLTKGTGFPVDPEKDDGLNRETGEFCFNNGNRGDIFLGGNKFAGFAGRVRRDKFLLHLQLHSAGWDSDMLRNVAGIEFHPTPGYLEMKKFVFSNDFLENIKSEIEGVFSRRFNQNFSETKSLAV